MKEVRDLICRVADSLSNVLITGERGTGKELVAKVIHGISGRRAASFVSIPCSAMSEANWNNELFQTANNGTLFFDEIGELPLGLQAKLVQIIEDKKVHQTGAAKSITIDVRIIPSTALNLKDEVKAKRFRDDLYYRLNVVEIALPPLRDRGNDIPLLAEAFLNRYSREFEKPVWAISEAALYLLVNYSWPGNVRELESVMERAVTLSWNMSLLAVTHWPSYGAPRYTGDLDIFVNASEDNASRILNALNEFGFGSVGLSPQDFIEPNNVIQLGHPPVRIDIVTSISGVSWEAAFQNRVTGRYGDIAVYYIGRKEFVTNKRTVGRKKVLADLEALSES